MSFFDIVNEDLFKPLTWSDKRRYMDILTLLWDKYCHETRYALGKTEMIDLVEDYLIGSGETITLGEDADDDMPEDSDLRSLATFFLRKLRATGWLIEREGEYEEENKLVLNNKVIPLLKSFDEVINPRIILYKGKMFEIYSMLSSIEKTENPYEDCLKEAAEQLDNLNQQLRQLAASIEGYIDKLTIGKRPEEILAFFEEYEDHVVVASYHHFKTSDNLYYFRNSLYENLDYCDQTLLDVLVRDCVAIEHISEDEARPQVQNLLREMRNALLEMEDIMRVIDDRHLLYRNRAVQRAQFLLLSDGSSKGKIAGLLKYYAAGIHEKDDLSAVDDSPICDVFQVYGQNYYDGNSLATPYKRRKPTPITQMDEPEELDPAYIEQQRKALMEYARNALTAENVNRYAAEILRDHKTLLASYVLQQDPSAVVKIIGLYTYSQSDGRKFNIRRKDDFVTVAGIRFRDFIIERA